MNKRGLSEVVTAILLILIAIAAVVIVWAVVKPIITSVGDNSGISAITTNLEIQDAKIIDGVYGKVVVKRAAGEGKVDKLKIVLSDNEKSQTYTTSEGLDELQTKTFIIPLELIPDKVEISPVSIVDGKEKIGKIADTQTGLSEVNDGSQGLVAYYKFEGNADDGAGDNDGVLSSGVNFADGKIGKAASFTGGQISVADSDSLDLTNEFTLSAWIKTSQNIAGSSTIVNKQGDCAVNQRAYIVYLNSGKIFISTASCNAVNSSVIADNNWHHITAVRKSGKNYIYVDGIKQAEAAGDNAVVNSNLLVIGTDFNGLIDEVRIYNKALAEEQVKLLAGE